VWKLSFGCTKTCRLRVCGSRTLRVCGSRTLRVCGSRTLRVCERAGSWGCVGAGRWGCVRAGRWGCVGAGHWGCVGAGHWGLGLYLKRGTRQRTFKPWGFVTWLILDTSINRKRWTGHAARVSFLHHEENGGIKQKTRKLHWNHKYSSIHLASTWRARVTARNSGLQ